MEGMTKTRKYNDKIYQFWRSVNTKTDAKYALKELHKEGWLARVHEYKDLTNRIGVAFAIYRKREKPVKVFVAKVKLHSKKRKTGTRVVVHRRK